MGTGSLDADALINQLIIDEGLRLKPYLDTVGKTTIGIGRDLTDEGITEAEARELCFNDIASHVDDLDRHLSWWRQMSELRQQALANMCFQLGWTRLSAFTGMLGALQSGDYEKAANEALNSHWATQVPVRAARIVKLFRGDDAVQS